jgi:hypothetical protein
MTERLVFTLIALLISTAVTCARDDLLAHHSPWFYDA